MANGDQFPNVLRLAGFYVITRESFFMGHFLYGPCRFKPENCKKIVCILVCVESCVEKFGDNYAG